MADNSFTTAMEYTAVTEEEYNSQDKRIIELEDSVDDQTVLTDTTDYTANEVSMQARKDCNMNSKLQSRLTCSNQAFID